MVDLLNANQLKMKSCVVVAHKFNDIYYSASTNEFKESKYRILIIIEKGGLKCKHFPLQGLFDRVYVVNSLLVIRMFGLFFLSLRAFFLGRIEYMFVSNPVLVLNQFLHNVLRRPMVVLVEDGLMNYVSFEESNSIFKKVVQYCLRVSTIGFCNRIGKSYLTSPSEGVYFFGDCQVLTLTANVEDDHKIQECVGGKSIFIGGNYYEYGYMSVDQYSRMVNKLMSDFSIDFYLPHAFASSKERIDGNVLNINASRLTLEVVSRFTCFDLYSFGATSSFTCKNINPCIKTTFFVWDRFSQVVFNILEKKSDRVLYVDSKLKECNV